MKRFFSTSFFLTSFVLTSSCSTRPPPDFAPDPGLVARIREIQMSTAPQACPGQTFAAHYHAILDDGTRLRFDSEYDEDRPPKLHVSFLERTSPDADALRDGGWRAESDPVRSVSTGFRLTATLRANPALRASASLEPRYGCLDRSFDFEGGFGVDGSAGGDGPDVTVRLAILRSPFYQRLLVAAIEVGLAPTRYVLADAGTVPPREWLTVESSGGRGGTGREGRKGQAGVDGASGCPGGDGGPGGAGGPGAPGGPGGRGGRITIIAPAEEPFIAGLVEGHTPGGEGGEGGRGGAGGPGGAGGAGTVEGDRRCANGRDGPGGSPGPKGQRGLDGIDGPRPRVITVPMREVLGAHLPRELAELLGR